MISRVKFVIQTRTPTPPKICSTHPTMMKLGDVIPDLKRIHVIHFSNSADISIFPPDIKSFCYQEIHIKMHSNTILQFFCLLLVL